MVKLCIDNITLKIVGRLTDGGPRRIASRRLNRNAMAMYALRSARSKRLTYILLSTYNIGEIVVRE